MSAIPSFPGDERISLGDGIYMILHHNAPGSLVSTTIAPTSSSMMVPYHLHPRSVEIMTVIKGELKSTIAGKPVSVTALTGPLRISPGVRHGFEKKSGEGEVVVCESTESWTFEKRAFFADLFNGDKPQPSFIRAMAAFYRAGDGVPAFGDWSPIWLGRALVLIVGGLLGDKLGFAPRVKSKMN